MNRNAYSDDRKSKSHERTHNQLEEEENNKNKAKTKNSKQKSKKKILDIRLSDASNLNMILTEQYMKRKII